MSVDVAALNYVPTLSLRASEMNGLEKLPAATKDNLQPLFLMAPWPRAGELFRAIDRITKAIGDRPFFLDVDRDYRATNEDDAVQQQWRDLSNPDNNFSNWIGFVESVPEASPCIQLDQQDEADLISQIAAYQDMGRSFALRIETSRFPDNLPAAISAINEVGSADYAIILDAGWVADSLPLRASLLGVIRQSLADIGAEVPVVLCYTTIPKYYTDVRGLELKNFDNREMLQDLRQATNRQKLIYGDWASTRPRSYEQARRGPPRIDLPLRNGWLSARNKPDGWDFDDAAKELLAHARWAEIDGCGVWGEVMIKQTAVDTALGINSAQKNTACRVNLHLHLQAHYERGDVRGMNLDEAWQD